MNIVKIDPLESLAKIPSQTFFLTSLLECQRDYLNWIKTYTEKLNKLNKDNKPSTIKKIQTLTEEFYPKITDVLDKLFFFVKTVNDNCRSNDLEIAYFWDVEDEYENDIDSFYNSILYSHKRCLESKELRDITKKI